MKRNTDVVTKLESRAAIGIFSLVVAICLVRSFFGVSVADEALYYTLADFPRLGAHWFVDDRTIQTTSAILISPFISAYTALIGTEAVVLFARLLYLCVNLFTAWVCFVFFKRQIRWPVALVLAAITLAFVPHEMSCLNYNSMGSQFFAMALMLSVLGIEEGRASYSALGGVFWVLCVFAYPTALVLFAVSVGMMTFVYRAKAFNREFLLGLSATALALALVLIAVGIDNVLETARFSSEINQPFNISKIPFSLGLLDSYLPPYWTLLILIPSWLAASIWRPQSAHLGFFLLILDYIFLGGTGEGNYLQVVWPLCAALGTIYAIVIWLRMSPASRRFVQVLIIPSAFGAVLTCLTSRMTVYNMYITGLYCALGTVVLVAASSRLAGWMLGLLLLGFTLQWHVVHVYEDDTIFNLTHEIGSGPFRYLRTARNKGEIIEALQQDLKRLPERHTIFFKDHFPAGYLMTDLKFIGPTANILPAFLHLDTRPAYVRMFSDKSYLADFVIELRYLPMSGGSPWVYLGKDEDDTPLFRADPFYNFFLRTGLYRVILDRGPYRLLQKI